MENKTHIVLIDDHAVLRAGLKMLLDAEPDMVVVGEAETTAQALPLLQQLKPEIVLLDISMPDRSGLDALKSMKAAVPECMFIILTMHNDEGYLRMALSSGASGYVLKQAANKELLAAIRVVSQGGTYLHPSHKSILFTGEPAERPVQSDTQANETDAYNRLSAREKEILQLIASGYTNRQAAEQLYLSEKTIETYKSRLMMKLGLHNRIELVRFALRVGIIKN